MSRRSISSLIIISTVVLILGCINSKDTENNDDIDHDGVMNEIDPNPNQSIDTDNDGLSDDYETVHTKTDIDNNDTDNDGWIDLRDMYPLNNTLPRFPYMSFNITDDPDQDGYPNDMIRYPKCFDRYPNEPSQWSDLDGDGFGDNPNGVYPDLAPLNPSTIHRD